ncbi:MAG: hypothetical protein K2Y35_13820 [Burkholderiales bacterium]|nr:hypothetical protein [Burkholderiales bacterium]
MAIEGRSRIRIGTVAAALLIALGSDPATAADVDPLRTADASTTVPSNLLSELEAFLRQRRVVTEDLTADQMVAVMIDWYRFSSARTAGDSAGDTLQYRYGAWSEGCATGFKLSLLRRTGAGADRVAGITLMFEPSSKAEIAAFSTSSTDWPSIERFLEAVQASPAFRQFGSARPMGVMLERGGLR